MKLASLIFAVVLSMLFGATGVRGQHTRPLSIVEVVPATVTVIGVTGKPVFLTEFDLKKLPQRTIKTTAGGNQATFEGGLLIGVLATTDLPTGERFHSTAASYYLLAEAKDDYRAVFAWAELASTFMDKAVYVVTERDGKP